MSKFFNFPKYLYLTDDYYLSNKLGNQSYHQIVLELVEPIHTDKKLNEYLTLFKMTGEIERTNSVKESEIGRELIITHNNKKAKYREYVHHYETYNLIPGKIAVYKCIAINKPNPARILIDKKSFKTRNECKKICQHSKIIKHITTKEVYLNKEILWNLIKNEVKSLNLKMNKILFIVEN